MAPNIYYWGSWSYLHNTSNVFTELGILHSTFYRGRVAGRVVHTMYMYVVQIIRKRSPTYVPRAQKPKTPSWASKPLFRSVTFTNAFLFFYLLFFPTCGFPRGFSNKFLSYELKILNVIEKCDYFLPRQNFQCLILFRASFFFLFSFSFCSCFNFYYCSLVEFLAPSSNTQ